MLLKILGFKNEKLGCFTQPVYDDHDYKDASVQLARALRKHAMDGNEAGYKTYIGLVMYYLGTFDDETGVINQVEPVEILHCDEAIESGLALLKKKDESKE